MRYCSKAACRHAAVASYAFNYDSRVVWLAPLTGEPHPAFYDLCEQHASSMRVPRGWQMEDLRSESVDPGLPAVPAPPPAEAARPEAVADGEETTAASGSWAFPTTPPSLPPGAGEPVPAEVPAQATLLA